MTYTQALAKQPWLRFININDVSLRLLRRTSGTTFIAFNTLHDRYELHSTLDFGEDGNSCDAVIDESWLNWKIINDFLANNHKRFGAELEDKRNYVQTIYDRHEKSMEFAQTTGRLDVIKRTLGRRV